MQRDWTESCFGAKSFHELASNFSCKFVAQVSGTSILSLCLRHKQSRRLQRHLTSTKDDSVECVCNADGEPSDDRRRQRVEDEEPAESRRRTADTDDTVLESQEQLSAASQDQGMMTSGICAILGEFSEHGKLLESSPGELCATSRLGVLET